MLVETEKLRDIFYEEFEYARCTCSVKDEQFIRTFFKTIIRTPRIKGAVMRDIA